MPPKFYEDAEGTCLRDVCERLFLLDDGLHLKFSLHHVGPVYTITGKLLTALKSNHTGTVLC